MLTTAKLYFFSFSAS